MASRRTRRATARRSCRTARKRAGNCAASRKAKKRSPYQISIPGSSKAGRSGNASLSKARAGPSLAKTTSHPRSCSSWMIGMQRVACPSPQFRGATRMRSGRLMIRERLWRSGHAAGSRRVWIRHSGTAWTLSETKKAAPSKVEGAAIRLSTASGSSVGSARSYMVGRLR